jgi:uncharacterized Fe-S center protein
MASKVFFTNMRCKVGESLLDKFERLLTRSGIDQIDFERKYTAIKIHFGEPGNLAYLRPQFARVLATHIKKDGGLPFLTDCNTLYVGRRNNALVHLDAAAENGWNYETTGCRVIIADGLKGTDDVELPVPKGELCKTARIGRSLSDADIIISLAHFKIHEQAGIGGTMKNIGMGGGSRAGKMVMHNNGKPEVHPDLCRGCKVCAKFCNQDAISYAAGADGKLKASIDWNKCVNCGRCMGVCNYDAIENMTTDSTENLNKKIVEYTAAVLAGKPHFHICVANNITPYCDCHNESDAAVVPDIGIFCGFDPVAVDAAAADAVNAAPVIAGSLLSECEKPSGDHSRDMFPVTNWRVQIEWGEHIGLGSGQYELVTVK